MPLFKVRTGNQVSPMSIRASTEWVGPIYASSPASGGSTESYVEAQDAIEALMLVKPDYTTWSEENLKSTGHLTDEAKQAMFDDYLLGWNADVRVSMLSRDNVVYSHAWVEELGVLAMEKVELEIKLREKEDLALRWEIRAAEVHTREDQHLKTIDGLRREHAQLIEERDKARELRDEYNEQLLSSEREVKILEKDCNILRGKLKKAAR